MPCAKTDEATSACLTDHSVNDFYDLRRERASRLRNAVGRHHLLNGWITPETNFERLKPWGESRSGAPFSAFFGHAGGSGWGPACLTPKGFEAQAEGLGRPGATVRARIPRVARRAPSGITGKILPSFQLCSTADQS